MANENPEYRSTVRLPHETPVSLEQNEVAILHEARMFNYSSSGLYFESDYYLVPGTEIFIGLKTSPFAPSPDVYECYRSVIQWRKYLEHSVFDYGYGVALKGKASPRGAARRPESPRRHARASCDIPALLQTETGKTRGVIHNVSHGGVFVRCDGSFAAGQRLQLTIPLRKRQKIVTRFGEVVWSDPDGLGIRFDPEAAPDGAGPS
jgi:Tfp pilus assembly protein PilZ